MTPPTFTDSQSFAWRVLDPNTQRAYELAAHDFELVTGVQIDHATADLARSWQASMASRGLAVNTIRLRLSALRTITGLRQVELPKRQKSEHSLLSSAQIRSMMTMVTDQADRMLLVRLLTIGAQARTVNLPTDDMFMSHMIGAEQSHILATQKITRMLKRYGHKAGLNAKQVNLRTWCLSGRRLVETLSPSDLSSLLDARAEQTHKIVEYVKPLHGIGRRSFAKA